MPKLITINNNQKMKTMKNLTGIVALLLITAISVNAQVDQTVTQGSTHHYRVTDHSAAGFIYQWSLAAPAAGNTVESPTAPTTNIVWGTSGTYTLTLTETNGSANCPTANTFTVLVLGAAHLSFASATSNGCADVAQDIPITFTDGTTAAVANYYPLVVNYTVNGTPRTVTLNFGDPLVIPLTVTDRADQATFANYNIPVVITSAKANEGTVILDTPSLHTNTVYDIPELNPITTD
jgi:hypothetical protein